MPVDGAADPSPRGRVVMLVDNGVRGDSRVQKAARSAADAGWEVVLLGMARDGRPAAWNLGAARVRLLPMPDSLARVPLPRRVVMRWLLRRPAGAPRAEAQETSATPAAPTGGDGPPPSAVPVLRPAGPGPRTRMVALARRAYRPWDAARSRFWLWREGDDAWRRLDPELLDFEATFGPIVDELAPDLIHANDFRMLGVGARAAARARAAGRPTRLVWDAHEFLPGLRSWRDNARWLPANCAHERIYAPAADAVVTISEELADLLREEHNLAVRPTVVLNAPTVATPPDEAGAPVRDLRADCGVGPDTPLVVYSGGITRVRGVDTTIEALTELPGVHLALVSVAPGARPDGYVADLLAHAERLGVADRVHLLPFVPYWQVYAYLSAADAAVSGLSHLQNHEIALSNKFFEYAHARLPVVVSDVRTMAATVQETGQGEVFRAGDPADLARAVRLVLEDPKRYRAAYERPGLLEGWGWDAQAAALDRVYTDLLPGGRPSGRAGR